MLINSVSAKRMALKTFENVAYVMAPAIFGIAMLSGISYGILLIALTPLVLLGLFFINLENLKKG